MCRENLRKKNRRSTDRDAHKAYETWQEINNLLGAGGRVTLGINSSGNYFATNLKGIIAHTAEAKHMCDAVKELKEKIAKSQKKTVVIDGVVYEEVRAG